MRRSEMRTSQIMRQPKSSRSNLLSAAAALIASMVAGTSLIGAQIPSPSSPAPAPPPPRVVVVLDPAHGGPDSGARLGEQLLEKDVTLAIAARLRASLAAAGFSVVFTREADSLTPLSTDQRAEIANRTRAITCIVIHATATGTGVHLYASALQAKEAPAAGEPSPKYRPPFEPTPWETAQAEAIPQSLQLLADLSAALKTTGIPVVTGRAPLRPLDNMICPAVAVELAPLIVPGTDPTPVTDPAYQQRLADTLARGLQYWRSQLPPPPPRLPPAATGVNP